LFPADDQRDVLALNHGTQDYRCPGTSRPNSFTPPPPRANLFTRNIREIKHFPEVNMTVQNAASSLTFDQLAELREKTERLSQYLSGRLKNHLATLYPILAPKRVFGKYLGFKEVISRADEAYTQLVEKYREVAGAPFDLRADLDDEALSAMEHGIEAYPWEYTLQVKDKAVTISSPVRWVITYRSDYSLAEMRRLGATKGERRKPALRHFVVNAIASQIVFSHNPGAVQLLEDLRYDVRVEVGPGLGKLPLLTISSRISSFRPPDELILSAIRLSGVPAFIELVDPEAAGQVEDPLRQQVEKILMG
jgi:hypothetical protein